MLDRLFRILKHLPARRLLDQQYYLRKYPDLAQAGVGPLRHYLEFGEREGRKPQALFDPGYYARRNPPAADADSPALHFLQTGGPSGMSPHPLFDGEAYLAAVPEARGSNLLLHFLDRRHPQPDAVEGGQFGCVS